MGSEIQSNQIKQGKPIPYWDDNRAYTKEYAQTLDQEDPLRCFREEFIIPTKADLKRHTLPDRATQNGITGTSEPCIYLCGNSLGLQPKRTSQMIRNHLDIWAMKGVHGHFESLEDSSLPSWTQADDVAAEAMAHIVGALASEVAVMGTLTANLHMLMCSFYLPTKERSKIIMEGKAFPSDHFAVESQIRMHNLDPAEVMILIEPRDPLSPLLTTDQIFSVIDTHASTAALLLLPGVQYYTGQLFDIPGITAYAKAKGIVVGWDLAHAAGNVELKLHGWDVDFAAWCNYKYLNSGPGAIAGLFVHEKHGQVDRTKGDKGYRPRLSGWWGGDKSVRFQMDNKFVPIPGAAGYQVSNPSAIDLAAVTASLSLFNRATLPALRQRSLRLTGYLEKLLLTTPFPSVPSFPNERPFSVITPSTPETRGAQLSILLKPGLLKTVMHELNEGGVVVDERKPDVVRVAPAPLYNSFEDCWGFVQILREAVGKAIEAMGETTNGKSEMESKALAS